MNTPNHFLNSRLQLQFNVLNPDVPTVEILGREIYAEYQRRWLHKSREVALELGKLSSRSLADHPEVFDDCIRAIRNPCLPDMDFLMACMMPHVQLRPVFTLMTGFNNWNLPLYVAECMLKFIPIDLIGTWLSLRLGGNRWRRGEKGTEFYVPNELDYAWLIPEEAWGMNRHTLHSDTDSTNLNLIEYIDRIFLGVGGLWSNVRLNTAGQTKLGTLLYLYNFRQNGITEEARNFPPIESIAMIYMTALTHGTIMPFHYRKILGDLIYDRSNATGGQDRPR